ncbi:hypothetical protein AK812_SmicGene39884 [Symbiodinium microadriaticum]|uniref:Uncharacterized protein n=1 Tax=Symbiodinium microadriaticum TaxID=2951 RepID=A0A1Q9CA32_SYMMI|nr:hypothetical protein AK812_SmicGene39884 [Symbiodinium microadriaticum]CAE7215784.1 unnamed protein product [Symbiodinium sp. KB8]
MVRAKSNGFASSLHERELVDAWASDRPTPQESFLDIELADELRHDYLDSMDAESRNKILCANEKVIKSPAEVHGNSLAAEALAVIRETKKSKNARKEWMQRLKDACGDVLLKKKFERDNSGNSLEAAADEAAPAPVAAGVRPPVVNPDEMDTLPFFPGLPLATSRASESERPAVPGMKLYYLGVLFF